MSIVYRCGIPCGIMHVKEEGVYRVHVTSSAHPFDDVFATLKSFHPRLLIPLINDIFGTDYSMDEQITCLPTDDVIVNQLTDGTASLVKRLKDSLFKIRDKTYLIECQSENDDSMVIRMAEYTILTALHTVRIEEGVYNFDMPRFSVVYLRPNSKTPRETKMRFNFPNGQVIDYYAPNILLTDLTKEEIIEKKLYALIPFYVLRYEKQIRSGKCDVAQIEAELNYFMNALVEARDEEKLEAVESNDIRLLTNNIIEHVVKKEDNETAERLVDVMGGNIIITESMKIHLKAKEEGKAEGKAEACDEFSRAFSLFKSGKCSTVEELVDNNIDTAIAELVLSL